jgi:cytochrome b
MAQVDRVRAHLVWDRFVRFFHWSLVACVAVNYLVIPDGKVLHQWVGYMALALVMARIVWGFIGSEHARFSDFFPTPNRLKEHVLHLRSGRHGDSLGHNPVGALMMLALMATVIMLGTTGWMQTLDAYWGEEWLQNLHSYVGNLLISMATLHALAAILMGRMERKRLIKAMITGVKESW